MTGARPKGPRVYSPLPEGSGAIVVHRLLARAADVPYVVRGYDPRLTVLPPVLMRLRNRSAPLVHTSPDHAIFVAAPEQALVVTFHNYVLDREMRSCSSPAQRLHYATDLRWFTRRAVGRARAVTAVSLFTARLVQRDLGLSFVPRVIPNGIDAARFVPAPDRARGARAAFRVLFSGNPTRRKGAALLPQIAERLPPNVEIVCVAPRKRLTGKGTRAIRFLGAVPHDVMPEVYRDADVLLMPSFREGMSLAVLEAMACGLPVVASDCSSMPELVHPGKGGFLCPPGEAAAFAEAIVRLADSPSLRRSMGEYNRALVERRHTMERMARAYMELFEQVLDCNT